MKIQMIVKRLIDLIVALILLVLLMPIWLIIIILIKRSSSGPILFIQERPGKNGRIFKVYKFRTMITGSEEMVKGKEVMQDDDRITFIGKFLRRSKIDEVPQILNVLKGEMSLIGPRPERIASLKDYDKEISKRLNMRPGMTGLAQVSGNIFLDLKKRYQFDVYYIEHFSLWLDTKILFRTVGVVLFGEKKYINKCLINMEKETITLRSGESV